jgi:hypothetical protein
MAKSKSEVAYQEATRKQEQHAAPMPVVPQEPVHAPPPLSPSAQARRDAEVKLGRERAALAETERQRLRDLDASHRAAALKEGKASSDDLS